MLRVQLNSHFFMLPGAKPELSMMYAGSKLSTVNELGCTKVSFSTANFDHHREKEKKLKKPRATPIGAQ